MREQRDSYFSARIAIAAMSYTGEKTLLSDMLGPAQNPKVTADTNLRRMKVKSFVPREIEKSQGRTVFN